MYEEDPLRKIKNKLKVSVWKFSEKKSITYENHIPQNIIPDQYTNEFYPQILYFSYLRYKNSKKNNYPDE